MDTLTLPAFFDAHVHFRQGDDLRAHVRQTARCCDRALAMPNLDPPLTEVGAINAYYEVVQHAALGPGYFRPLMTLYLTPETSPEDVLWAKEFCGDRLAGAKLYPRGATTKSQHGVPFAWWRKRPAHFSEVLRAVADCGLVLNIHGEDPDAPLLEREARFLESGLLAHAANYGGRVVMEHVSTCSGVRCVRQLYQAGLNVACTLTLHHLVMTLDDTYGQVHNCCRPAPLNHWDREALLGEALAATPWCFLGSDSAPHRDEAKYRPVAECGCYTSPCLAEKLAEVFAPLGERAVEQLTAFTSANAGAFYGVPASGRMLRLSRYEHLLQRGDLPARPWQEGELLHYRLEDET